MFGLLWGCLFGVVGASLKIARGQWRHMLFQYLRTFARPQVAGMIVGGLAATGLGVLLSLVVLYSFMAYTSYTLPLLTQRICFASGDWQHLIVWSIAQGPLYAVNLFAFSFGAPVTINNPQGFPCFYTSGPHTTLSLFGTYPQLSPWTLLLLALPIICLFLGGRASAAIGRTQGIGPGAIQGALIAVPFTVLMMFLTVLSTITYTSSGGTASSVASSSVQSAGVGAFDLALWALVGGAVVGALGGMYETSSVKTSVSGLLADLAFPLMFLTKPAYSLLDRLTGQPRASQRSSTRSLLYGAVLCALLMVVLSGVAGIVLIAYSQFFTLDDNVKIRDIIAVIMIALPGLLLLCACASALSTDP